jgi:transcriptional regulator with XRE-family HTH domain
MELALDAGVSTRHLSFVESGRSQPSASMVLRLAEQLAIPFRDRNHLLLAAGHAPAFPERSLDDPELEPVRSALDQILERHNPYPGVAVDRAWNVVAVNSTITSLIQTLDVDPALLEPPVNAVRISFHPNGFAPLIVGIGRWRALFRERLERQLSITGKDEIRDLLDELDGYDLVEDDSDAAPAPGVLGPLRVRIPGAPELTFFGMFATFDAPFDVTSSELALELLFPGDATTAEFMESLPGR